MQAANLNILWCSLIVEELSRHGIVYFCLSPGSRSAPLAVAVAHHPQAEIMISYDERGAAFHALGYARATGRPAVLICSSGSAGAHYLPAVIEAFQDHVPMIILTADRPPELKESGANQTIRQNQLYGNFVRWSLEFPCPQAEIAPEVVLSNMDQAIRMCNAAEAGPVHLNLPFREPLAPVEQQIPPHYLDSLKHWLTGTQPYTRNIRAHLAFDIEETLLPGINETSRGLLLLGQIRAEHQEQVLALANRLAWPVFADVCSGLRLDPRLKNLVPYGEWLLAQPTFAAECHPEMIVQIGTGLTTRGLLTHLDRIRAKQHILISEQASRRDPNFCHTLQIQGDIGKICAQLQPKMMPGIDTTWRDRLCQHSQQADLFLTRELETDAALSEPAVARILSQNLSPGQGLWLGNSMPVRDFSSFAAPKVSGVKTVANRGVSGIDGHVACAAGFAQGLKKPVFLLCGDLTLFHDLNSLHQLAVLHLPVTVVVINNQGGGIFSFLPIAQHETVFETYFATPHTLSFAAAAAQFSLDYSAPKTGKAFTEALKAAQSSGNPGIIEVRTHRDENLDIHRRLQAQLSSV